VGFKLPRLEVVLPVEGVQAAIPLPSHRNAMAAEGEMMEGVEAMMGAAVVAVAVVPARSAAVLRAMVLCATD